MSQHSENSPNVSFQTPSKTEEIKPVAQTFSGCWASRGHHLFFPLVIIFQKICTLLIISWRRFSIFSNKWEMLLQPLRRLQVIPYLFYTLVPGWMWWFPILVVSSISGTNFQCFYKLLLSLSRRYIFRNLGKWEHLKIFE